MVLIGLGFKAFQVKKRARFGLLGVSVATHPSKPQVKPKPKP